MSLRNRTFFKSIRFRFIIMFTLILAATFSLFSIILYYNFRQSLGSQLDDLLQSKAEGVMTSIDTYWQTEKMDALEEGGSVNVFTKVNNINFARIAERWVKEKSRDPELMNIVVQIYSPVGNIIASSENSPGVNTFTRKTFDSILDGNYRFESRNFTMPGGKPVFFRVLTVPVFENRRAAYVIQVSSPLAPLYAALNRLKLILFLLLPLTVFTASIIAGEFLASITLRPLNKMIKTVRQITAQNLKLRIDLPESKDEIRQLADTFNNMLEKINKSFVSQQQFIQDISHELRTPLTILKGELEVALKKVRSPQEYSGILRSNLEEIEKINRIVENFLMLMRLDSEEIILQLEPVDLVKLLKDILDDMSLLAGQKGIKIDVSPKTQVTTLADREKLSRVFLNLLDNAIKYTPAHGRINVELEAEGDFAKIKINDTGIGIEEKDLPFIFDRFYQVDKSRSNVGFGLGLSIAKSIIQAHKGIIEAQSLPQKGTTFTISLPLKSAR